MLYRALYMKTCVRFIVAGDTNLPQIIAVQHAVLLCSWHDRVVQQHAKNALLCVHYNSGYCNAPQYYVKCALPILL